MLQQFVDGLSWLLTATGPPLIVLGILGFVFQEKWKQLLTRSMTSDLERLKHELALAQQRHAASLAPQLEAMKHDLQRDLEAYKTSLIAQAEEVKLKTDLRKSLGNRYLEIKFTRLMALEVELARTGSGIGFFIAYPESARDAGQLPEAIAMLKTLGGALAACEMFLSTPERQQLAALRVDLAKLLDNVGPGKEVIPPESPVGAALMLQRINAEDVVRSKIHEMAGV